MNTRQNPNGKADMTALVAAAKNGDQDAFTALYEAANQDVYRSARAVLRSEEMALDVQQDTFIYAFTHLGQLEDPAKFRAWVRGIAVNQAKSALRKQNTVLFTELENEDGEGLPEQADLSVDASPELSLERKETARLVNEILGELSDGQRAAVGMYYYEQMSVSEIADALGVNVGTVKAQLSRGRKKIETAVRALEKRGVKLYGLSPIPFLVALMRRMEPTAASGARQAAVKAAVTKVSADAVASAAVPVAAKTFGQVLTGRLLAGALAVALIGGGIWGGAKLLKSSHRDNPYQPTTVETNERLAGVETPEELTETGEDLPVITEPVVTEPAVTEPTETEPVATDPAMTEPSETEPAATEPLDPDKYSGSCGENLTWRFDPNSGLLTIEGSGAMDDFNETVDTPSTYKTPWAGYRYQIRSVSFPSGMTRIGENAFSDCEALTSVTIPDGVTEIGDCAFWECYALKSVTLPDGLTVISYGAFAYSDLNSVTIPGSVSEIGKSTFGGCENLTNVTISEGVTAIGQTAFAGCERLPSIIIPNSVTRIGESAFLGCVALKNIMIPDSVIGIGEKALGYDYVDGVYSKLNGFTVFGYENSAAQRYASENGFAFESLTENRDEIAEILRQERYDDFTRLSKIIPIGTRYLAKVEYADPILATEEELQQARQSGKIVLNGTEYRFTESLEEAKEWGYVSGGSNEVAWIAKDQSSADVYSVIAMEDGYGFKINAPYQRDATVMRGEYRDVGRIWLEADTEMIFSFFDGNLGEFFAYYMDVNHDADIVSSLIEPNFWLRVDENGTFYLIKTSEGIR